MHSTTFDFDSNTDCYFKKTTSFIFSIVIYTIYILSVLIVIYKLKMKSMTRSKALPLFVILMTVKTISNSYGKFEDSKTI